MEEFVLRAQPRTRFGSREARRLRSEGLVPANIYGHQEDNLFVSLDQQEFRRFLEDGHRVATVEVNGRSEPSVVKEVQYDALGDTVIHVDFARVSRDETIRMEVPVETVGVAKGVASGGFLETPRKHVLIAGRAGDLPERVEINIEELKIGDAIRVRDLVVPPSCVILDDPDLMLASVHSKAPVVAVEPPAIPQATEPEVIGRKKEGESEEEKK